jgi:phosphotransferase system  glucose/maltose/N-acetylglucosamine-specific IIC component
MPRTVLTPVAAVRGGGVTLGAGTSAAAAATGMIVASPGAYKLMIQVANASVSTMYVIFRAGGYQGTPAGAVNAGYLTDQYQPFAGASSGDLSVPVASNATVLITDLDTGRYSQPPTGGAGDTGGALWIDVSLATSVTIWTIQRPYV